MGNKYAFHWGAILLAVLSVSAAAETEKSSDPSEVFQIQEVVVTAQKRQQNLQDVPIAISALGAQKISDARIDKVEDISALAPNVITLPQIGGNQLAGFSIRGIVASNSAPESDNPVSIYVDGVYIGRPAGAVFEFADIDRLEILRGPQGTLFGRNSTGGAINIITADPAGKLGGRIDGTISNYSGRRFRARFDTPEWAGLSAQFNYFHNEHDGDVRNLGAGTTWDFTNATNGRRSTYTAGQTLGSDDTNAYRVALRFHPSDEFNILYKYDRTENHGVPAATGSLLDAATTEATYNFFNSLFGRGAVIGDFTQNATRPDAVNNWFTSRSNQLVQGHTLTAEWKVSDALKIKNIGAYRSQTGHSINQIDGVGGLIDAGTGDPLLGVTIASETNFKQYSEELQVLGSLNRLDVVGGLYYFRENVRSGGPNIPQVFFFSLAPNNVISAPSVPDSNFYSKSTAVFAQATFHATNKLDFTLGGRQTWDKKSADYASGPILGKFPYDANKFNYLANMTYRPNSDIMVYASTSTGFLSGGTVNGTPFQPEEVTNYEIGAKTDLLDRRLRLNGAVFHQIYKNLQFTIFPAGSAILLNAGKSRIDGAELEVTAVPIDRLTLTAGLGYTHFKYTELDPRIGDPDTFTVFYRPKWTGNVGADYALPRFENGSVLTFGVDTQGHAQYFTVTDPSIRDRAISPETWVWNARVALSHVPLGGTGTNFRVQAWAKNLSNKGEISFAGAVGPSVAAVYRPARTYGIDMSVNF